MCRRNAVKLAFGVVHPRVVGAADVLAAAVATAREQLMGTMATGVEKTSQLPVRTSHHEYALVSDGVRPSVTCA